MKFTLGKEISDLFSKADVEAETGNMHGFNILSENIFDYIYHKKNASYKKMLTEKLDCLRHKLIAAMDVDYFMDFVGVYK